MQQTLPINNTTRGLPNLVQ